MRPGRRSRDAMQHALRSLATGIGEFAISGSHKPKESGQVQTIKRAMTIQIGSCCGMSKHQAERK